MSDFQIKKGARLPSLRVTLRADGIDAASAVTFKMKVQGGSTIKSGTAVIESATNDQITVRYDWGAADTDTVGLWNAEWWVTVGGLVLKLPLATYAVVEVVQDDS